MGQMWALARRKRIARAGRGTRSLQERLGGLGYGGDKTSDECKNSPVFIPLSAADDI